MGKGPSSGSNTGSKSECSQPLQNEGTCQWYPPVTPIASCCTGNTAVGLNNTLECINHGMAAALCMFLSWVGVPALCAPQLHSTSCQPGFAPWAQHFSTKEDLWTWVVLSKSRVPVWLGMCCRKLSVLQDPVWAAWMQQVSWPALTRGLINWSVLCTPLKAPSKLTAKGQMSSVMKGEVSYFTTRFERNPIHSSSGTIMASETYFVLKAESRMQVRMTWLLWNLHLQEAEGRNVYNKKQNKTKQKKKKYCSSTKARMQK